MRSRVPLGRGAWHGVNTGTCKTTELAINHAFRGRNSVIFAEDDAVFAANALTWFLACAETDDFRSDRVWAISGESIFFNARAAELPESFQRDATDYASRENLVHKFSEFPFIPSTCFATSAQKWSAIGPTRGLPDGDVVLCQRGADEGKTYIQPIVARVRDIGMLHDLGYSVSIHTKAGVQELKNTYLTSDELAAKAAPVIPHKIDPSRTSDLYRRSTLLEGFGETPMQPPPSAPTPETASAAPHRAILSRTLVLIEAIPPGTFVPDEQKCFDEHELQELGVALTRLLYAPSQIRRRSKHGDFHCSRQFLLRHSDTTGTCSVLRARSPTAL